jgi:hypothetical protein
MGPRRLSHAVRGCIALPRGTILLSMKRLQQAPNLALATLWADMLSGVGVPASVQRAWVGSIVVDLPPDQSLPEIWLQDEGQFEQAGLLLRQWQNLPHPPGSARAAAKVSMGPSSSAGTAASCVRPEAGPLWTPP